MSNNQPIRILQCVNKMDRAGLETMIMNYYRNIDRKKIQFDFLTHRAEDGDYDDEIKKLGGRVYHAPRLVPGNYLKYFKYMKNFFEKHPEYKIIHSHIDTMSYFPLKASKNSNIPIRISHSHTTKLDKDYKYPIKFITKKLVPSVSNQYYACGIQAGKFLYKKNNNIKYIKNAINLDAFRFDDKIRDKKRKEFNISKEKIVIGHVGRYIYIKNQIFLIKLLAELLKDNSNYILVLVGTGKDKNKLLKKAKELKVLNNVIFLENRKDVNEIYNIFDIFVMPSLFEGMPLVAVEAQANGLTCIFSEKISKEVLLTKEAIMLPLDGGISNWKNIILNKKTKRNLDSIEIIRSLGYDIKIEAKKLGDSYINLYLNIDAN